MGLKATFELLPAAVRQIDSPASVAFVKYYKCTLFASLRINAARKNFEINGNVTTNNYPFRRSSVQGFSSHFADPPRLALELSAHRAHSRALAFTLCFFRIIDQRFGK